MANAPPVLRRGEELQARHLLLGNHIPQSEFHPQTPSFWRMARPVTNASALTSRQSRKRGRTFTSTCVSIKAARSMGETIPERSRSAYDLGQFHAYPSSLTKSSTAMGSGSTLPCVISIFSAAPAGRLRKGQRDHPSQKITNTHETTLPANPQHFAGSNFNSMSRQAAYFSAAFQTAGTGEWRATRFQPRRENGRPIAYGS